MSEQKRLVRSASDRMLAGVSAGIADYLNVDPVLIRLAFVALTLMGGHGILIYILMWIVMPTADAPEAASKPLSGPEADHAPEAG